MDTDELRDLFTERFGEQVLDVTDQARTFTVTLDHDGYVAAAQLCRDDPRLAVDLFDSSFGVDEREEGFSVVTVLYSTTKRHRILLRTLCSGGRDEPRAPSLTHVYRGANWMERETYDMFGIEFDGHPGLLPRILCVENFEGWPLRKDFFLASREAKPWPGVKEPAELDEDGNVIVRPVLPGDAPGPSLLDEVMAKQAKEANPVPAAVEAGDDDADTGADAEELVEAVEPGTAAAPELPDGSAENAPREVEATPVDDDAAAAAQQTADDRRREQAEARRRKAEQRAAASDDATAGDDDDGAGADTEERA